MTASNDCCCIKSLSQWEASLNPSWPRLNKPITVNKQIKFDTDQQNKPVSRGSAVAVSTDADSLAPVFGPLEAHSVCVCTQFAKVSRQTCQPDWAPSRQLTVGKEGKRGTRMKGVTQYVPPEDNQVPCGVCHWQTPMMQTLAKLNANSSRKRLNTRLRSNRDNQRASKRPKVPQDVMSTWLCESTNCRVVDSR